MQIDDEQVTTKQNHEPNDNNPINNEASARTQKLSPDPLCYSRLSLESFQAAS